jgi:hypothetical protein
MASEINFHGVLQQVVIGFSALDDSQGIKKAEAGRQKHVALGRTGSTGNYGPRPPTRPVPGSQKRGYHLIHHLARPPEIVPGLADAGRAGGGPPGSLAAVSGKHLGGQRGTVSISVGVTNSLCLLPVPILAGPSGYLTEILEICSRFRMNAIFHIPGAPLQKLRYF